jgi:ureidoacrylate peracid hydrolase
MSTALLVVDLQNAFCRPEGSFARRGLSIDSIGRVVDRCRSLVEHARRSDWLVVLTRLVYAADYRDAGLLVDRNPGIRALGAYREGSFDAELVAELLPVAGDSLVVRKTRYDPFLGTGLEAELRARDVGDVVVCGVTTNVCVESTVRSAHDLDFSVRIVEDAMSSYDPVLHRASIDTMARHFATRIVLADLIGEHAIGRGEAAR